MSAQRIKILISNDDGYDTSGIRELAAALSSFADVFICAPLLNNSGASSALTHSTTLNVNRHEGLIIVHGTPADCVNYALSEPNILPWMPDLTVTGINIGSNLGDDTIYSGTVSAAAESVRLGIPAMAVSLACIPQDNFPPVNFHAAAKIARDLVKRFQQQMLALPEIMLNVNIPDLPVDQIKEPRICMLGRRHPGRPVIELGRNKDLSLIRYQLGFSPAMLQEEATTDFDTIEKGHVTITPLQFDMTARAQLSNIASWLPQHWPLSETSA